MCFFHFSIFSENFDQFLIWIFLNEIYQKQFFWFQNSGGFVSWIFPKIFLNPNFLRISIIIIFRRFATWIVRNKFSTSFSVIFRLFPKKRNLKKSSKTQTKYFSKNGRKFQNRCIFDQSLFLKSFSNFLREFRKFYF